MSLYRGVLVNILVGTGANMIFFYVYNDGKKRYNYDPEKPFSLTTIMISLRSGITSMLLLCPLWTIKTRLILYKEREVI